jgi:hypothetical protein
MTVEKQRLVKAFSDSIGKHKARSLIQDAAREAGVHLRSEMTDEKAVKILEEISEMDDATAYMHIAANTLSTEIKSENF